jgi:rhodanese-related sulfurtransferase
MGDILQNTDKIAREKDVIIYCRSGNRSANIVRALEQHFGFTNLFNLKGGMLEWADEIDPDIPKY